VRHAKHQLPKSHFEVAAERVSLLEVNQPRLALELAESAQKLLVNLLCVGAGAFATVVEVGLVVAVERPVVLVEAAHS
jgi:hypothetical protein